ncbi:hypothetical protein MUA26_04835 [Staphylococcus sp. IVB6246]|uniref:hypothetical protein n=1 Tax=Staphylococcus sp. IVB6246 TaxID=2989772 RepID=UPI0021D328E0|nr:hypothetical protein [Staphylococcus sp. IVB6246]UXR70456.1 hypothetical protein MUA26_04835 [Staphylococcus sp. IVB6246]
MKKLLVFMLTCTLILAACNHEDNQAKDKESEKKVEKTKQQTKKKSETPETNNEEEQNTMPSTQQNTYDSIDNNIEPMQQTNQNVQHQVVQEQQQQISQPQQTYKRQKVDLNSQPPSGFSTEGLSEEAQQQINDLGIQKDFYGLSQYEFNDRVSDIINNDIQ